MRVERRDKSFSAIAEAANEIQLVTEDNRKTIQLRKLTVRIDEYTGTFRADAEEQAFLFNELWEERIYFDIILNPKNDKPLPFHKIKHCLVLQPGVQPGDNYEFQSYEGVE